MAAHEWLDWLWPAIFARVALSFAATSHQRAVEHAEGAFAALKSGDSGGHPSLVKAEVLRAQPAFWVSAVLCVAAEVAALYSVVLGGAVSLPLLAAGGVLLDAASRWLLLSEPLPRPRVLAGGGLALVAAALAAHFAPLPLQLSGDQFWHALHARSARLVVGLPLAGLLAGEVIGAARLLRSGGEYATLLSVQAGLLGSLGALGVAGLGACLRHELVQRSRPPFDTPCAVQLGGLAAVALHFQGSKARQAYAMTEHGSGRTATRRAHAATLIVCAPLAIAVVFADAAAEAPPSAGALIFFDFAATHLSYAGGDGSHLHLLGFASFFDVIGFGICILLGLVALSFAFRPKG